VLAPNAKLRAKVVPQSPDEPAQKGSAQEDGEAANGRTNHGRAMRPGWAKLLKRVFNLDLEHCPNCGGELKIIAAILERASIEKILTHRGLQARAPPRAPARGQMPLLSAPSESPMHPLAAKMRVEYHRAEAFERHQLMAFS
jgi:hypothetical protein